MRQWNFTLLILIGATATALAGIGESEKEIEARYGKPDKLFGQHGNLNEVGYVSGGFMIMVAFINGTSQREGFASPDISPLSKDNIDHILSMAGGPGLTWKELPSKAGTRYWNRSDWKAIAVFPPGDKFFFIQDPSFVQPH